MMEVGLLWYDGSPKRSLEQKTGPAARRYQQKFDHAPNIRYVHPDALSSGEVDWFGPRCWAVPKTTKARSV